MRRIAAQAHGVSLAFGSSTLRESCVLLDVLHVVDCSIAADSMGFDIKMMLS